MAQRVMLALKAPKVLLVPKALKVTLGRDYLTQVLKALKALKGPLVPKAPKVLMVTWVLLVD
jgi:hypothetical protein